MIPNPDTTTVLSPIIASPVSAVSVNLQQFVIHIQVLLSLGQDRLSTKEAGKFLDQWVHVVTTTQEIQYRARNFIRVNGDYLGSEGPLRQEIATCP